MWYLFCQNNGAQEVDSVDTLHPPRWSLIVREFLLFYLRIRLYFFLDESPSFLCRTYSTSPLLFFRTLHLSFIYFKFKLKRARQSSDDDDKKANNISAIHALFRRKTFERVLISVLHLLCFIPTNLIILVHPYVPTYIKHKTIKHPAIRYLSLAVYYSTCTRYR